MENKINRDTIPFPLLRASIWGTPIEKVGLKDYDEMQRHTLLALPAPILSSVKISSELYQQWNAQILRQVSYNANCRYVQSALPISVPYAVLKGTSAAQYYPRPELRTLGDIDILTKREDADIACESLLRNGYREMTSASDAKSGRHRTFLKYGVVIEIHYSFAIMNDPEKAKAFDALIVDHLDGSHVLPNLLNGLVLIEHINQHLESGLGFRQIVDWMVFADRCLTDEAWTQFRNYATRAGLETLAIVTTRMCEIYLGLPEHEWCRSADEQLCTQLMRYVLESGNFGRKKTMAEKKSFYRFVKVNQPIKMLKELQQKGKAEWKAARNPFLKPFAWVWKGSQFIRDVPYTVKNYRTVKLHKKMLKELGVVIRSLDRKK